MNIIGNEFINESVSVSLSDIGIDTDKVADTIAEMGDISSTLYLPINDNDKLLSVIDDIVTEIAIINGYFNYPYMTLEESEKSYPNVFPIAYKAEVNLKYSPYESTELQIWIEPVDPKNVEYLDGSMVLENIPVELDNEDIKYLLNVCAEVISSMC